MNRNFDVSLIRWGLLIPILVNLRWVSKLHFAGWRSWSVKKLLKKVFSELKFIFGNFILYRHVKTGVIALIRSFGLKFRRKRWTFKTLLMMNSKLEPQIRTRMTDFGDINCIFWVNIASCITNLISIYGIYTHNLKYLAS